MLARGKRFAQPPKKDSFVGPDSYVPKDQQVKELSLVPFNSTAPRWTPCATENPCLSPASHFSKFRLHRVLGCKSLQWTAKRLCKVPQKRKINVFSYDPFRDFTLPSKPKKGNLYATRSSAKKGGRFYKESLDHVVGTPIFKSSRTGAIPENIEVIRQYLLEQPLPKYLKFPGETNLVTLKYKGCNWGKRKEERFKDKEKKDEYPGPATYDPKWEICCCNLQAVPSLAKQQTMKELNIGNEFAVIPFYDTSCDYIYKKVSHNKKGTLSTAKRWRPEKEREGPDPWSYQPQEPRCWARSSRAPFLSRQPRFRRSCDSSNPSPSLYTAEWFGSTGQRLCAKVPSVRGVLVAPFNSTAPRMSSQHDEHLPGPAHYDVTECNGCIWKRKSSMARSKRFPCPRIEQRCNDYYEVQEAEKKLYGPVSHHAAEGVGFLSSAPRIFDILNRAELDHDSGFHHPIVSECFITSPCKLAPMNVIRYSKEKEKDKNWKFYDLPESLSSSVYKRSFNKKCKDMTKNLIKTSTCSKVILNCFVPEKLRLPSFSD